MTMFNLGAMFLTSQTVLLNHVTRNFPKDGPSRIQWSEGGVGGFNYLKSWFVMACVLSVCWDALIKIQLTRWCIIAWDRVLNVVHAFRCGKISHVLCSSTLWTREKCSSMKLEALAVVHLHTISLVDPLQSILITKL